MIGIETQLNLHPDVALSKDACKVASPITASPSKALLEKLGVVFECGLDFAFSMILHIGLMAMIDHPASDEVVIVCVELVLPKPPFLIGEAVGEIDILQNVRAICTGASRQTGHAAIHVGHGSTIEVATFKVESSKEIVDAFREGGVFSPSQSLTSDHTPIFGLVFLLEGSQEPW